MDISNSSIDSTLVTVCIDCWRALISPFAQELAVTTGPQNRIIIKEAENINLLLAKYYHCNRKYEGENKGIMGE